jgi:NADPH-dependent 2,4-dienoyl-CoA reductase/sulfur reductase-like enzyme
VAAERVLAEGRIDMVGMTRAQIADPELANKAREGRLDDIRPCVGANQCIDRLYFGRSIVCIHNPAIGREKELASWTRAPVSKRVVVVGGGPAGLEAARMASLRGHRVLLLEQSGQVGGQVLTAGRAPGRGELLGITRWLEGQARKQGVEIRLNVRATPESILSEAPEAVIVATGGRPYRPDLPGFDAPNVVTSRDVLDGLAEPGPRVLVIDDDGAETAPSVAEHLAHGGRAVEIITPLRRVGEKLGDTTFPVVYRRLYGAGVVLTPNLRPVAFHRGILTLRNVYSGQEEKRSGIDTVVLSMGNRSADENYRELKGRMSDLHLVGDAMAPRGVHHAILEGTRAGRRV